MKKQLEELLTKLNKVSELLVDDITKIKTETDKAFNDKNKDSIINLTTAFNNVSSQKVQQFLAVSAMIGKTIEDLEKDK